MVGRTETDGLRPPEPEAKERMVLSSASDDDTTMSLLEAIHLQGSRWKRRKVVVLR